MRLSRLQSAADVLRRTARFVVVARRLQMQMQELDRAQLDIKPSSSRAQGSSNGGRETLTGSISEDLLVSEGEKERALAKAALSVSELGETTAVRNSSLTHIV